LKAWGVLKTGGLIYNVVATLGYIANGVTSVFAKEENEGT